jgi:transcriptional regulator with XRE-family HTH domain
MLGKEIKSYLDEKGIKYSRVAETSNIPTSVFSAMLNGKRNIKAEEYFAICKALDVSAELFCHTNTEESA